MNYDSIDDLIYEVNRVALLSDPEILRAPCIRHVQDVYKKVGYSSQIQVEELYYVTNMSLRLPETTLRIVDVRYNPFDATTDKNQFIGMKQKLNGHRLSSMRYEPNDYEVDGNKIRFFSKHIKEVLVLRQTLPVDESGMLLIDSRIYSACVAYCRGEELMVKASNTKQERSTLNPAMVYKRDAMQLIDEARAQMNSPTFGQERAFKSELFKDQRVYESN